jgi:GYF domain 2
MRRFMLKFSTKARRDALCSHQGEHWEGDLQCFARLSAKCLEGSPSLHSCGLSEAAAAGNACAHAALRRQCAKILLLRTRLPPAAEYSGDRQDKDSQNHRSIPQLDAHSPTQGGACPEPEVRREMSEGWHYVSGEQTVGPLDLKDMQGALSKMSDANVLVWRVGFKEWTRAADVPELAALIDKPPAVPRRERWASKGIWRSAGAIAVGCVCLWAGSGEPWAAITGVPVLSALDWATRRRRQFAATLSPDRMGSVRNENHQDIFRTRE